MRYNIGSDNGPADPTISSAVKSWNEKYVTPVVKITTVSESFSEFEKLYGDMIPSFSGAFTGYWEDGAASTALETSWNRKAAANINLAGCLAVMNQNAGSDQVEFDDAWRNVLLYDEHTWGSWNSISDPENPFTLTQWANKRQFAVNALEQSKRLLNKFIPNSASGMDEPAGRIEIINTHSWTVSDMVTIPASVKVKGDKITDNEGKIIPYQRLSSGDLVFVARNIPAFGSRIYILGENNISAEVYKTNTGMMENDLFRLRINDSTGSAESLFCRKDNFELTDRTKFTGLNSYIYVEGRMPLKRYFPSDVKYEITERGPVTMVMRVTSSARGTKGLTSYYQFINSLDKVIITCEIDKEKIYTPEGVYLAFPFNIHDGVMHINLGYGVYRPEADQLKGSCKNYYTPERWVDISNQERGVTWITPDAPVIETGDITTDANAYGWIREVGNSSTVLSYVMNNYWGTNYKAGQDGKAVFRYVIHPHGMFIPQDAERLACQETEPLIAIPAGNLKKEITPPVSVTGEAIVVTALIPMTDGYLIHIFNSQYAPSAAALTWNEKPKEVFVCDFDGNKTGDYANGTDIPGWGIRIFRVRR